MKAPIGTARGRSLGRPTAHVARRVRTILLAAAALAATVVVAVPMQLATAEPAGAATSGAGTLITASGQYYPIAPVEILDTRYGIGGYSSSIGANQSATVPVLGVGGVPVDGVSAVFVNIEVLLASQSGYITDYSANLSDPGHASVNFYASHGVSGSDIVPLAPDGSTDAGEVTFTNHSTGTVVLAAQVEGYFMDSAGFAAGDSPGDTYVGLPWTTVCDTRTNGEGCGNPNQTQLQPGNSMQFDVATNGLDTSMLTTAGVSAGDIDAVEIEVGALTPGGEGYLNISGLQGAPPLRSMTYEPNEKTRLTDIVQPDSSGNITITNGGSYALDVQVNIEGGRDPPVIATERSE